MSKELNLLEDTIEKTRSKKAILKEEEIKRIIEALLFSSSVAISLTKLKEIISETYPVRAPELRKLIEELKAAYKKRACVFQIDEIAEGFLLRTIEEMRPFVEKLYPERRSEKLSKPATEVLAIIAGKGPITRSEVEKIRGVDSSSLFISLVERELIEVVGRKEVPGRPLLYGITKKFLHHFGFKDARDLINLIAS